MARYSMGLDFGTESVRALIVDVQTGEEMGSAVVAYPHGVITNVLPVDGGTSLPRDWALQDPDDYLTALSQVVPAALNAAGVKGSEIVALGVDFTACTILPTKADGTPLCRLDEFRRQPHAWVKLWKHHGAAQEAEDITTTARQRGEPFLRYFGGAISSEWLLPKTLQIWREAPAVYAAADHIVEGGDWLVWQLTGVLTRNATAAGYKGMWTHEHGFPSEAFLAAVDPGIHNLYREKVSGPIKAPGERAGGLTRVWSECLGLRAGTPVSVATIDAHAGVPGCGVVRPGTMAIIMGTSSCHMLLAKEPVFFQGFAGLVKDGIVRGYYGYESGQTAVGDIFAWFVRECTPAEITSAALASGRSPHEILTERADRLRPGESGLIALDWWNGNRSILMDARLSGLLLGATLNTRAHEIYRALIEATAFGTRVIVESYVNAGISIADVVACGGLAERNPMLMQINADVLRRPIAVAASSQTVALGAAMFGALAAGSSNGGYDSMEEAAAHMVRSPKARYVPVSENAEAYEHLYAIYLLLHDQFGRGTKVMAELRRIAAAQEHGGNA